MKSFVIAIKDNEQSIRMLNDCLMSAKTHNWNVETFWGVDKTVITEETWKNLGLTPSQDKKFQRRVGAQGCFLSHYHLWLSCLELSEPIIILEHDAVIINPYPDINTDKDLVKLYRSVRSINNDQFTGNWSVGSQGYYITPLGADKLITWSKENFGYHLDVMIGTNILNYDYLDYDLISLNKNNKSTITIK
jgi:GR25 family glycosyltransferase involved in LPS biosynthesis